MKNSELVKQIIETLGQTHPNLYHDVTEGEIQNHIALIKNIDNLTSIQFDYEMLKLFALFKESHTSYIVPYEHLDHQIKFKNQKFYVFDNGQWKEILNFEKLSSDEFLENLQSIICYETKEWLSHQLTDFANNAYIFKMLGLNNNKSVELTTINGEKVSLSMVEPKKDDKPRIFYYYKILDDNILYVNYKRCFDDPNYPFKLLVEHIAKEIDRKKIKKYILDIRGNAGGNSEVLNPFQELVKKNKMEGCVLINEGVFSSGIFAVMRFKKYLNATLIGQPTGGTAKHYGYIKRCHLEGKVFTVSTRLFDFSKFFGYENSIKPDIVVEETIKDIQDQRDVILNKANEFMRTHNFIEEY